MDRFDSAVFLENIERPLSCKIRVTFWPQFVTADLFKA